MPITSKIRYVNKKFTNPIMKRIAGKAHSPIALILHQGRRSGIRYETPIMVERTQNGFLFALTYGPEVDWYKNVLAAGKCSLRFHGCSYELENPCRVNPENGLKSFPFPQKLILKWLKIEDFFEMTIKK